jgi:hypothetical protein
MISKAALTILEHRPAWAGTVATTSVTRTRLKRLPRATLGEGGENAVARKWEDDSVSGADPVYIVHNMSSIAEVPISLTSSSVSV